MESNPPLRERSWYAVVWWVPCIISGLWTLFNAFLGILILLYPGHNEEQGFEIIAREIFRLDLTGHNLEQP